MKCSIQGCPGQYESRQIVHTLHRGSDIFVFEHVPAEVCSICGDTLLAAPSKPDGMVPVYEYAQTA